MEEINGVFRTSAFGGFNKDDVLRFIEMQKRVEADLRAAAEDMDARLRALSVQLDRAVEEKNNAETRLAENPDAREATSALAIKEAEYRALENKYAALQQSGFGAQQENAELRRTVDELRAHIADLERAPSAAPVCDATEEKSVEAQVGSAMVDARRFADQIISEAKEHAAAVNEKTLDAISAADKKTAIIAAELQLCAEKCARLFAEVNAELAAVKKELAGTADSIG